MWLCGWSESPSWLDSLSRSICSKKVVKMSGMYSFPMLWLKAILLIVIWMASLASHTTCLLSWSIILKWEILTLGWLLFMLCWWIALKMWLLCSLILYSKHWLDSSIWEKLQFSSWQDYLWTLFCLKCDRVLSLGCIRMNLRVLALLEMTCTLVCHKIPLDSSLKPGTYGKEMKIFLFTSKPVSGFSIGVVDSYSGFLMIQSG